MKYFVLECTEDGDIYFQQMAKDELMLMLDEDLEGGNIKYAQSVNYFSNEYDLAEGPAGRIIIKGEVVVPSVVEVATKVEIK